MPQNHSTASDSERLRAVALVHGETDEQGRPAMAGKVAVTAITGTWRRCEPVATTRALARNAAHLARLLRADAYPAYT